MGAEGRGKRCLPALWVAGGVGWWQAILEEGVGLGEGKPEGLPDALVRGDPTPSAPADRSGGGGLLPGCPEGSAALETEEAESVSAAAAPAEGVQCLEE